MGIFCTEITVYDNFFDVVGHTQQLGMFLLDDRHHRTIMKLRDCNFDSERIFYKRQLPQATISGIFSPTRNASNLVKHSGLICIDIDGKENTHIKDWNNFKHNVLGKIKEVAYASLSVSGKGCFAIIPIKYPEKHREHFRQLQIDFGARGITLDKACSDVTRLRCLSFDPDPFVRLDADVYEAYYKEPRQAILDIKQDYGDDDTLASVASCCEKIARSHTDITHGYQAWFEVGAALASLGEVGRKYYHIVSSQNPTYNQQETNRKFNSLLRRPASRIGIGTFFHHCKENNITP